MHKQYTHVAEYETSRNRYNLGGKSKFYIIAENLERAKEIGEGYFTAMSQSKSVISFGTIREITQAELSAIEISRELELGFELELEEQKSIEDK